MRGGALGTPNALCDSVPTFTFLWLNVDFKRFVRLVDARGFPLFLRVLVLIVHVPDFPFLLLQETVLSLIHTERCYGFFL